MAQTPFLPPCRQRLLILLLLIELTKCMVFIIKTFITTSCIIPLKLKLTLHINAVFITILIIWFVRSPVIIFQAFMTFSPNKCSFNRFLLIVFLFLLMSRQQMRKKLIFKNIPSLAISFNPIQRSSSQGKNSPKLLCCSSVFISARTPLFPQQY